MLPGVLATCNARFWTSVCRRVVGEVLSTARQVGARVCILPPMNNLPSITLARTWLWATLGFTRSAARLRGKP